MIWKTKVEHWVDWLEGLDESSIWQASKIMTLPASDASKSRIPTLVAKDPITKRVTWEATDNESKGKWFYKLFFPPTDLTITPIPQNYQYLPGRWTFTNITEEQIHQAIKKMKPYKASPTIQSDQHTKILPTGMVTHGDISSEKTRQAGLHEHISMATHCPLRWSS